MSSSEEEDNISPPILLAAPIAQLAIEAGYKKLRKKEDGSVFYWILTKKGAESERIFCKACAKEDENKCEWNDKKIGGKMRGIADDFEKLESTNKKIRYEVYRSYTALVHGRGVRRTPLPLCVEIKIGKTWPSDKTEEDRKRTGFEPSSKPSKKGKKSPEASSEK